MKILIVAYEQPPNCAGVGHSLARFTDALECDFEVLAGNHCKSFLAKGALEYYLSCRDCDLIHFWGALPTILLPIKRKPYIVTLHGSDVPGRNPKYDRFYRWCPGYMKAIRRADRLVAVTKKLADMVTPLPCEVIKNGYTPKNIVRRMPQQPMLVTVGRLIPLKRVHILVEMMNHLPTGYLTIVGDGPERDRLRTLAVDLGVNYRVKFVGWSDNPAAHFVRANVYVSAADATGVPLAMIEAMEWRLPIVTTDIHDPDLNAIQRKASPFQLAHAVKTAVESRHYEALCHQPNWKTWSDVANKYTEIYNDVCTNR